MTCYRSDRKNFLFVGEGEGGVYLYAEDEVLDGYVFVWLVGLAGEACAVAEAGYSRDPACADAVCAACEYLGVDWFAGYLVDGVFKLVGEAGVGGLAEAGGVFWLEVSVLDL